MPQAIADLEAIHAFIARDSKRYARAVVREILRSVKRIGHYPRSGRVVPELGDEQVREILLGNYRILYLLREHRIEILAVVHAARQIRPD